MISVSNDLRMRTINRYTKRDCGLLAIALHDTHGYETVACLRKTDNGAVHFGVRVDGALWDIRGILDTDKFCTGFGATPKSFNVEPMSAAVIATFYRNPEDKTPSRYQEALADFDMLNPGVRERRLYGETLPV